MEKINNAESLAIEDVNAKSGMDKVKGFMKLAGPAWLAIALNIGGATVANAGALASRTGFAYLWAIVPEVFVIWIACILFVKVTLSTGLGPVAVAREHLGDWAGWVTATCIFVVNTVFHAIQYALIGNIMNTIFGVSDKVGSVIGFLFVIAVVLNPAKSDKSLKIIQTVLKWMVWILLASFALVLVTVPIDWAGALKGFIPSLKGTSEELVLLSGLMGAAIAINVPAMAAYGAKQNKWGKKHGGLSIFELTYTNLMLVAVQIMVMIAVASVLHPQGIMVTGAGSLASTFEPFAGKTSVILLSLGLLGSVLSTMVSQCLISGYIISDVMKWEVDLASKKFKISELVVTLFGLSAPLLGWNAFAISSYGAGFNLTFFPIACGIFLVLGNKKEVMGDNKAPTWLNVSVVVAILLSLLATWNYWSNLL